MAEQTDKKDAEAKKKEAAAAKKKEKEAKKRVAAKDLFKFKADPEKKLAPQAAGILGIIKAAGKKGMTREELVAGMEGVITTRQTMSRILAYYQKPLVEAEAIEVKKAE